MHGQRLNSSSFAFFCCCFSLPLILWYFELVCDILRCILLFGQLLYSLTGCINRHILVRGKKSENKNTKTACKTCTSVFYDGRLILLYFVYFFCCLTVVIEVLRRAFWLFFMSFLFARWNLSMINFGVRVSKLFSVFFFSFVSWEFDIDLKVITKLSRKIVGFSVEMENVSPLVLIYVRLIHSMDENVKWSLFFFCSVERGAYNVTINSSD